MSPYQKALSASIVGLGLALGPVTPAAADDIEFYSLYRSPYFLGRGNTGIAVADNHEAIFYNPAGLALGKGIYKETVLISPTIESSVKTKDIVRQALIEEKNDTDTFRNFIGHNIHLGLNNFTGVVFRRAAVGIAASGHTNALLAKSKEDRGVESLKAEAAANRVATFSFADDFWNQKLLVGATAKYVMRHDARIEVSALDATNIADQLGDDSVSTERTGMGVDLGLMYRFDKVPWRLGLHAENLGGTNLKPAEADATSRRLPQVVSLGSAVELKTRMSTMMFLMDYRDIGGSTETSTFKRLHLGAEMNVAKVVGLVGGLNQGYPSAGVYLNLYVMRFDIGTYTQEVGTSAGTRPDQRLYFRLMAGF